MNNEIINDTTTNCNTNGLSNFPFRGTDTTSEAQNASSGFITSRILPEFVSDDLYNSFFKETDLRNVIWNNEYQPQDTLIKTVMAFKLSHARGGRWTKQSVVFRDEETGEEVPMKSPFVDDDGNALYSKEGTRIDGTKSNSMATLRDKLDTLNWDEMISSPICYTLTAEYWEENHDWWIKAFERFRSKIDYWLNQTIPNGNEKNELLTNHDWSKFCALWVLEYQMKVSDAFPEGRGACHYHLIFFNAPNGNDTINSHRSHKKTLNLFGHKINDMWWRSIYPTKKLQAENPNNIVNGQDWGYVRDAHGVISYLTSYLTGSKGQKGQKKDKKLVPDWVTNSNKGRRHWGVMRTKALNSLSKIDADYVSMKAHKEVKKVLSIEINNRIMETSLKWGKNIAKRIGRSNEFDVFNVVSVLEPYEGYWKENPNKNRHAFITNADGSPRITQRIRHNKVYEYDEKLNRDVLKKEEYILFDINTGEVLSIMDSMNDYRYLINPVFLRNVSLNIGLAEILDSCPTLKQELDAKGAEIIDYRSILKGMKLLTDKAVA